MIERESVVSVVELLVARASIKRRQGRGKTDQALLNRLKDQPSAAKIDTARMS